MKAIRTNKLMRNLLEKYHISLNERIKLPTSFRHILKKGVVMIDGCFFFKHVNGFYSDDLMDRTGSECFHNKLWIDYISDKCESTLPLYIKQGIELCVQLFEILACFDVCFNIILSYNGDCVDIRFHKVRESETWLVDDIESYTSEGILIVQVYPPY